MKKIRKGDKVQVICGKDKKREGIVTEVKANGKLLIQDINIARKHVKPNPNAGIEGGIVPTEMPIDASNVMIVNPTTDKPDRVGFKMDDNGKKVRYFKSNNEIVGLG